MSKPFFVQKNINKNFKSVWQSKKPYNVLKGGRNSFKSSVVALLLVYKMIQCIQKNEKVNVVVIRKVANTLRDSVYLKIQWAISKFGLSDGFNCTVSPFKIRHEQTGSTFFFYGQDDFQKLKSNDIGNIIAVWYEESAEFDKFEEFDQTNITFMRQKADCVPFVQFFWSYNPPRNPYSWINEWVDSLESNENYLVHSSSYLDDELGFVTSQMIHDIERIKDNDYDYYRYLYLGEPVGLGSNVYNATHLQPIKQLPEDEKIVLRFIGIDGGHSQSATTYIHCGLTNKKNVILLNTFYYSPKGKVVKKAPSELSKMLYEFIKNANEQYSSSKLVNRTIDSAEGALRNQYFKDYGVRLHPVAKKKKQEMIDSVYSLFAEGRFFYLDTEENEMFIEEHRKYQYEEKTLNSDEPKVVKDDDHTCDAFQYLVVDNAKAIGLRK